MKRKPIYKLTDQELTIRYIARYEKNSSMWDTDRARCRKLLKRLRASLTSNKK